MFKNHVVVRTMAVKCGWFSACAVDNGSISLAMKIVIRRGPASDLIVRYQDSPTLYSCIMQSTFRSYCPRFVPIVVDRGRRKRTKSLRSRNNVERYVYSNVGVHSVFPSV